MNFEDIRKGMTLFWKESDGDREGPAKVVKLNRFDETVRIRSELGEELDAYPDELSLKLVCC